ncbi:MAG: RNA polymerase sigma factor SigJ [Acidobacteriota bacterium]
MGPSGENEKVEVFNAHRPRLFGLAYRMLGTRADAEDILQETYLRLHSADLGAIENPEAWLVTAATHLSIDRLRKAYVQRRGCQPLILDKAASPEMKAEIASDVSLAFLVMLERLSPLERAVFLLHNVFDFAHSEVARIVAKSETAVRQIVSRARARVRADKHRFETDDRERAELIRKFVNASYARDENALMSIFADDVALTSDGGGKVHAAWRTVFGSDRILRVYTIAVSKYPEEIGAYLTTINGEPGVIEFMGNAAVSASTFTIEDNKVTAIYRVMHLDKLKGIVLGDKNNLIAMSQNR